MMAQESGKTAAGPSVRFPPPLVFLGFVLLGPLIEHFVTVPPLAGWWQLGATLIVLGVVPLAMAQGLFRKTGENPVPWTATGEIIDSGIYGVTRNPMYLGMTIISLGLAVVLHSWLALLLLPIAVSVIDTQVIASEEPYLAGKFGAPYRAYMARVPRCL